MICVYNHNETNFNTLGLAKLHQAYDAKVTKEINMDWTLDFKMPPNDPKLEYVRPNNIIKCEDQLYRVLSRDGEDGQNKYITIGCVHVFFADAVSVFFPKVPSVEVQTNRTGTQILKTLFAGSKITVLDDDPNNKVTMTTDFFQQSKACARDVVLKIPAWIGEGELEIDNWTVRYVKRIGKERNLPLKKDLNLKSVKIHSDDKIVNRLYAFGPDDMPLPASAAPNGYIDSPESQALYGVRVGYRQYDDIFVDANAPQKLLNKAKWEMHPDNTHRIDMPRLGFVLDVIELHKLYGDNFKFGLGDTMFFSDPKNGISEHLRISKYEYYPYAPKTGNVTIGIPRSTYGDLFYRSNETNKTVAKDTNTAGVIKHTGLANDAVDTNNVKAGAITANEIAAKTITANQIKAQSITAAEMLVDKLSAITADFGTMTAGTIVGGYIKSDTDIDVNGEISIGRKLTLKTGGFASGIFFVKPNGIGAGSIDVTDDGIVNIVGKELRYNGKRILTE